MEPTLVILAAGMGSRFGGLKQITPVDPYGHAIIDFSLYDAYRAGFRKVAFIIKHEIEADFKAAVGKRMEKYFNSHGRRILGCFLSEGAPFDPSVFYSAGRGVIAMLMLRIAFEFAQNILQAALRGVGDTRAVFMSGVVVSLCVYLPGFFIVTNLVPTAAAYWAIMVATSIIGGTCNLLFLTRRSR